MPGSVIPLESNPEVFTKFARNLGLSALYSYHDVYSLTDADLLSFIPRPSPSIILLFPVTANYESQRLKEEESRDHRGADQDKIIWFKQTIKNACGLYALLNSISNLDNDSYEPNSKIIQFKANYNDIEKTESLIKEIESEYNTAAEGGNTKPPDTEDVAFHFLAFVKKNGAIYELDGRRDSAFRIGNAGNDNVEDILGEKAVLERIQTYIQLTDDENKLNFSLMALAPSFE